MTKSIHVFFACGFFLGFVVQELTAGEIPSDDRCTVEYFQTSVRPNVTIEQAQHKPADPNAPERCMVLGNVEHGSRIGFAVALPRDWNGKFVFHGIGGFGGMLFPLDLPPLVASLMKGYATATTDTGHQGTDAAWALDNPAAVINHYESGVEIAARTVHDLISTFYHKPPDFSFFEGCSAGGRQGLIQAQRFPSTFDGIIAGAPAWNYSALLVTFIELGNRVLQTPNNWISPGTFEAIDRMVMSQCDGLDGVDDGIILDPAKCAPDLEPLRCRNDEAASDCLTPAQLKILNQLQRPDFAREHSGYFGFQLTGADRESASWGWPGWIFGTKPPRFDETGELNFAGMVLPQSEDRGRGPNQFILGEQFFKFIVMNDPEFDARSLDFVEAQRLVNEKLGDILDADDTDLGTFVRLGGKLLIWHGWSDPAIPPAMSIDLYERILRDTPNRPGAPSAEQSARLFLVPGMQHCLGGSGLTSFDMLDVLDAWVTQGESPERVDATQPAEAQPVRSRPLCPYPKSARYLETSNPDSASSFVCR